MLDITTKLFSDLSTEELYGILQLRSEVFVVEQDCVYQDIDGKDEKALHIIGRKENNIVAYTRIFNTGDYLPEASIGRVAVRQSYRKYGYGVLIIKASIKSIQERYNETTIVLSAQTYLKKFYNTLGFTERGEVYLEDGIPHIKMIRH